MHGMQGTEIWGNSINDHTKACKSKRDAKRKENDRKDEEKKRAHLRYTNVYMHLMDETPDIVEKLTSKQKVVDTIKKKKKE